MSLSNSSLIQEGGAGGHVRHPFEIADNGKEFLDLFDEVVDYVEQGSAGKPGSAWVKLDGINLSVRIVKNTSGQYEFALDRGTQDPLDVRGITVDKLEARGMNPGLTQKAKILLDLLNPTIGSTMNHLKKLGLIQNPNLILNVEYVDNYQVNLVKYDIKNFIAIHGLRLIAFKEEIVKKTGLKKREISDYPYNVDDINAYAKALTKILQKKEFVVLGNPEVKKSVDINLEPVLARTLTLNGETKSLKNWILGIEDIPKKNGRAIIFTKKEYQEVDSGDKTGLTESQIRDYILYYATIHLGDVIMNSVKSDLGKGSDQEGLMIKRKDGQILKITGKFILSGMEGLIAKQKSMEEAAESFTVGIMFGRFNPPHKGHIAAWDQMNKDSDLDAWYVGTNKSTIGKKDPLPSDVKEIVIKTLYPDIEDHFVFEQTWLTLAAYVYEKYKKDNMTLICYTDEGYVLDLLKDYNGKELKDGKKYLFSDISLRPTERISSASALRAAVKSGDKVSFTDAAGISADTKISVGGKKIAYFDLVKTYLQKYIEEAAQPKKYFAKLSDSTAKKRKSFWKGLGKYPFSKSEYERADEVPGDSKETRPSKYNKKYRAKFEQNNESSENANRNDLKTYKEFMENLTISEDLGNSYEYKLIDSNNIDIYRYVFLVKDTEPKKFTYLVSFNNRSVRFKQFEMSYDFELDDITGMSDFYANKVEDVTSTYSVSDVGNLSATRKIISTVIEIISDYVRKTDPKYLYFAADRHEPSRVKLYDFLTNMLMKKYNYELTVDKEDPNEVFYTLSKKGTEITEEKKRSVTALKKKAKASGVPYSILKQVYNRGMAAWVTGHRPGATQSAWAFARVNSFLTKGKTWYGADADLAKKARKYLKEAHMFGYTDWGWITPEGISVRPIETDKTHTSILRRLGEKTKYNLSKTETEFSVTKKGWIRWLLDKNELRFNTSKWNGSINVQKTINSIVNKYLNAKEYSFEWLGNSGEYQRIEVEDPGAFMLKLSVERRKGLMTEDQDNEIEMISGQLKKIIDLSTDTLNIIQNGSEIPAWIQDKVSVSVHNAEAIFDYYHYSESKDIKESVEIISETITCSKKTGKKVCFVLSKKGKKLGGPYSETKAKKRLRQIEFFKHLNK
jgi:hypothetical protein